MRADEKWQTSDETGSLADCDEALALNPGCFAAYNIRGAIRGGNGDFAGARADFEKALAIKPGDPTVQLNLDNAKRRLGL